MHILISSLAVIISLLIKNGHCTSQDPEILTDKISSIYFDIEEFQKSLNDDNPSTENLLKIVKEMGSTLILMLAKLESSKSFESAFITKMQNINSEMTELKKDLDETESSLKSTRLIDIESSKFFESAFITKMQNINSEIKELKKDLNETESSLSTRIIDIENDISKLKKVPTKVDYEPATTQASAAKEKKRKIPLESDFYITPPLPYVRAKSRCIRRGQTPFVSKTEDDFLYLVERLTSSREYGWLPLTDISQEGVLEWDDGTNYEDGPLRIKSKYGDTIEIYASYLRNYHLDCLIVNNYGVALWGNCSHSYKMLCVTTE